MSRVFTHIGIAFYAKDEFPHLSAVVLSTHMGFDHAVLCGTVIETVNGQVVSWREYSRSPTPLEPYLKLVGIIMVATVECQPINIYHSLGSLEWKAQDTRASSDNFRERFSNDYVRRVLLHLCNNQTISLPFNVMNNIDGHIMEGLIRLLRTHVSEFNPYPVISLV
jgi:hypothetical protein